MKTRILILLLTWSVASGQVSFEITQVNNSAPTVSVYPTATIQVDFIPHYGSNTTTAVGALVFNHSAGSWTLWSGTTQQFVFGVSTSPVNNNWKRITAVVPSTVSPGLGNFAAVNGASAAVNYPLYIMNPVTNPTCEVFYSIPSLTICQNENESITASGGTSYTWTAGTQTSNGSVLNFGPVPPSTYSIQLSGNSGTITCGVKTFTLLVNSCNTNTSTTTGVSEYTSQEVITDVLYYDLLGRRVTELAPGTIYVRRVYMQSGRIEISKVLHQ